MLSNALTDNRKQWFTLAAQKLVQTCSHSGVLKNHSVVDEADVFERLWSAWSFTAQQVKYPCRQHGVFAILNELTEMCQAGLLCLGVLFDYWDHRVNDRSLVLKASLHNSQLLLHVITHKLIKYKKSDLTEFRYFQFKNQQSFASAHCT